MCVLWSQYFVRYCVALTLNPGQTGKWHLEREPNSSWPVLYPFSLECRWKHEPALWTFLAPSSMAVKGPQVPYLQLVWILCTSKVLSAKDNDECYASARGFWQSDFKRGRANFKNNTSGFWFLSFFPIPKPCSCCCLGSIERKKAYGNAEVEYKLKTSKSHDDLTIILDTSFFGSVHSVWATWTTGQGRRTQVNRAWVFTVELSLQVKILIQDGGWGCQTSRSGSWVT